MKIIAPLLLLFPFISAIYLNPVDPQFTPTGIYTKQKFPEMIDYLQTAQGRVNVEVHPSSFLALNAFLGQAGIDSTYIVFRESSIGSLFMTPMRNSLSLDQESFGIDAKLTGNNIFLAQSLDEHLNRAEFLGVKHLLVVNHQFNKNKEISEKDNDQVVDDPSVEEESNPLIAKLSNNSRLQLEKDFGHWQLFKIVDPVSYATALKNQPTIFYGDLSFKLREEISYDYVTLQERVFKNNSLDTVVVQAKDNQIDSKSREIDKFQSAILTSYSYKNIDQAFAILEKFSLNQTLILVADQDPLFQRLSNLKEQSQQHKILIYPRIKLGQTTDSSIEFNQQLDDILKQLKKNKISVTQLVNNTTVTTVEETNKRIKVTLSPPTEQEIPVLVKYNYFPAWQVANSQQRPYLATTTFMLFFVKDDFELIFTTPWYVYLGFLISLLAILQILTYPYWPKQIFKR